MRKAFMIKISSVYSVSFTAPFSIMHSSPSISIVKSNIATDPSKRLSDADILDQLSTFLFAGSDTTALALAYCLHVLSLHPEIQIRLREEILAVSIHANSRSASPVDSSVNHSLITYADALDTLPYLDSVVREVLRLYPPVHGTIRVATADDLIPISHPIELRDGTTVPAGGHIHIRKGSYVHIPIEGLNLSEDLWGKDARVFK
jgi:cytochrome P450